MLGGSTPLKPREELRAPRGQDVVRRQGEARTGQPGQECHVLKRRRHLPARKVKRVRLRPPPVNQRRQEAPVVREAPGRTTTARVVLVVLPRRLNHPRQWKEACRPQTVSEKIKNKR